MKNPLFDESLLELPSLLSVKAAAKVFVLPFSIRVDTEHPALEGFRLADDVALVREGEFVTAVPGTGDMIGHGYGDSVVDTYLGP